MVRDKHDPKVTDNPTRPWKDQTLRNNKSNTKSLVMAYAEMHSAVGYYMDLTERGECGVAPAWQIARKINALRNANDYGSREDLVTDAVNEVVDAKAEAEAMQSTRVPVSKMNKREQKAQCRKYADQMRKLTKLDDGFSDALGALMNEYCKS